MNNSTRTLILSLLAASLVSCATTSTPSEEKVTSIKTSPDNHWYLVSKNPSTYFPIGYPEDSPTTSKDGDWIYAGSNGEQWFVPKEGVKGLVPEQLNREVFAMRTDVQVASNKYKALEQDALKVGSVCVHLSPLGFAKVLKAHIESGGVIGPF